MKRVIFITAAATLLSLAFSAFCFAACTHEWSEWYIDYDATCTEKGSKHRYCDLCNLRQDATIPAIGHHVWGEWKVTSKASCGYKEEQTRECLYCDEYQEKYTVFSSTHTWLFDCYWETWRYPTPWRTGTARMYCDCYTKYKTKELPKAKPVIKLKKKKLSVKVGKTVTIKIKKKAHGDPVKSYKSSNKKIATVNKKGKVTGKAKGKATITVKLKSGVKAKCKIIVK